MTYHTPVLLKEVVTLMHPLPGSLFVDGTVGGGGHAGEILRFNAPDGRLIGLDRDEEAMAAAGRRLEEFGERVRLVRANFADMENELMALGITTVDGVLLDLGVSSRQFDEPARGFSFLHDGPLDMRMDTRSGATARELLRTASVEVLADIFFQYGEERRARAIAREVGRARERGALPATTTELAALVERVVPRRGRIHPATRVFQALRIAVNHELENLRQGLAAAARLVRSGGRVAVISFHSLEYRMVKEFFREQSRRDPAVLKILTKKPVVASDAEVAGNPRARSAKLRVAEKR